MTSVLSFPPQGLKSGAAGYRPPLAADGSDSASSLADNRARFRRLNRAAIQEQICGTLVCVGSPEPGKSQIIISFPFFAAKVLRLSYNRHTILWALSGTALIFARVARDPS